LRKENEEKADFKQKDEDWTKVKGEAEGLEGEYKEAQKMLTYWRNKKIWAETAADWKIYDEKHRDQANVVKTRLEAWNKKKSEFEGEDKLKKGRATLVNDRKVAKEKAADIKKRHEAFAAAKKKMEEAEKAVAAKKKLMGEKKAEMAKLDKNSDKYKAAEKLF